jgi:hypothetical protein
VQWTPITCKAEGNCDDRKEKSKASSAWPYVLGILLDECIAHVNELRDLFFGGRLSVAAAPELRVGAALGRDVVSVVEARSVAQVDPQADLHLRM